MAIDPIFKQHLALFESSKQTIDTGYLIRYTGGGPHANRLYVVYGSLDKCYDEMSEYYEGDEIDIDGDEPVDWSGLEQAYLFNFTAYRGDVNYEAFVRLGGRWYYADLVSEGVLQMFSRKITAKLLLKWIAEAQSSDDEDDEDGEDDGFVW